MSYQGTRRLIEFLKPRPTKRSVAFLLCVVLSGLFWLLISLSKEYVDEIHVPVVYQDLPENLLITNEPLQEVVAEVKGHGFNLLLYQLRSDNVQLKVTANPSNLSSIKKGNEEVHYLLTQKDNKVSSIGDEQLEVLQIYPDTLYVKFATLYQKKVRVKLDATISYAKQFGPAGQPMVEPDSILISGQRQQVEPIDFVSTERQEWTELDEALTAQVPLINENNPRLVSYSSNDVQVSVNVAQYTEGSVTIPVNVISNREAYVKIYPRQVEVKYQLPLVDYNKVTPEMFRASVRLNSNNVGNLLVVELEEMPVQVRQTRIIPAQVEYILQK